MLWSFFSLQISRATNPLIITPPPQFQKTLSVVKMGLWIVIAFSLLLTKGSSVRDVPQRSCHPYIKEGHHSNNSNIFLTLHHPRSPCSPGHLPNLPFSDVLRHDHTGALALTSRVAQSSTATSSVSVPVNYGSSVGVPNYVAKIGLGTPSEEYTLVIDTGSSLSWLQCAPCRGFCHQQVGAVFNPNTSSSYTAVSCSDAECALQTPRNCTPSNVCIYAVQYGDGSFTVGYLSKDTLTLGSSTAIPSFVFGCGQNNQGLFGRADGLIGLDRSQLSLISQLSASSFAYCLPATNSAGYLSIGSYDSSTVTFTPMLINSMSPTLYFLQLTAITVGGTTLPVSASSYTGDPAVIDSGTLITRLPGDVYTALSKAVVAALPNAQSAPAFSILDTCFQGSVKGLAAPEMAMVFGGGAVLSLPAENAFIDLGGFTCLAFATGGGLTIIGHQLQQTFRVVYDVGGSKIGFGPSEC